MKQASGARPPDEQLDSADSADRAAREQLRERWWMALVLACLAFGYFSAFRSYGLNLPDEGTLLYKFERMADGQRLYADFHAGYTPGVFYVHSFLQEYLGQSILPGRVVLALANSLSVAMLYLVAAPVCGNAFAVAAALLYPAFMPVHPGHFASFNVPYPTWYSIAIFLAGLLAARGFLERQSKRGALWIGLLAGLGFLFKPNVGAFQLACGMLMVLAALPRRGSVVAAVWWWVVWVSVLVGVFAVFGGVPGVLEGLAYVSPVLVGAAVSARRAGEAGPAGKFAPLAASTLLVGGGFLVVTIAWLGHYATIVPLSRLLEEALFVGSDYAAFFYSPHPQVLLPTLSIVAVFMVAYAAPTKLLERGFEPARVAAAAVLVVGSIATVFFMGRPMLLGFAASVMSEIETSWVFAAALAGTWLMLGIAWFRRGAGDALLAIALGAPLLYAGNYPRTDFMHWVWAAPVAVVAGAAVLSAIAIEWSRGASRGVRMAVSAALLMPLLGIGGLRIASAVPAIWRLDGAMPNYRASIQLGSHRAPVWMNIGKAESYRDLEVVADVIRELTEPGEKVFTFPALDIVSFISDRDSPLRDSYFFPGWIGHDDEARDVEVLRAASPRFAVILHDHWAYFEDAPVYYTAIGAFLADEYRRYLEIGRYTILAHRSVRDPASSGMAIGRGEPDPRLERYLESKLERGHSDTLAGKLGSLRYDAVEGYYPSLVRLLDDTNSEIRGRTVDALRQAGDDRVAAALFRAARSGELPDRERLLALRLAGAWAGAETVLLMKDLVDDTDPAVAAAARYGVARREENLRREAAWFGAR